MNKDNADLAIEQINFVSKSIDELSAKEEDSLEIQNEDDETDIYSFDNN